jgi:hypothetical protein
MVGTPVTRILRATIPLVIPRSGVCGRRIPISGYPDRVDIEVVPEPDPELREAVERALTDVREKDTADESWWRAGVLENLELSDL